MSAHDDPENIYKSVKFTDLVAGRVCVARHAVRVAQEAPGIDFYLVVSVDASKRRALVRTVDGAEFEASCWCFDGVISQRDAEALGAVWRVPPQERPGTAGRAQHAPSSNTA